MTRVKVVLALCAATAMSGCSHFYTRPVTTRTIASATKDHPATRVLVTYGDYKSGVWLNGYYCEGAQPDVGVGVEQSLNALADAKGPMDGEATDSTLKASLDLLNKTAITALAGRSQAVLVTRDLLFYSCLLGANGFKAGSPPWEAYGKVVDLVDTLAKAEQQQAQANAANATAAKTAIGGQQAAAAAAAPAQQATPGGPAAATGARGGN